MQSSSAAGSSPLNTKTSNKLQVNPGKTNSLKTKSTTVLNLSNPSASKDLETSLEIEKISKKISEHADALYRTWKSHGLAPTEILDLYNVDTGVASGAIVDDKSTEDLQKLVNTFVNKDKEQRGVKTAAGKTKLTATNKSEIQPKIIEHKINTSSNKLPATLTSGHSNVTAPVLKRVNVLTETPTQQQQHTVIKKSTPSNTKSPNFLMKTNTTDATDSSSSSSPKVTKLKTIKQGANLNEAAKLGVSARTPSPATNPKTLTSPSKSLDIDIDFNLDLDLNLDVHKLSQQQTHNLQKIKELLKEPNKSPSLLNASKIPGAVVEPTPAKAAKEVKVKKSVAEKNKQNEETPAQKKTPNETQATKKLGNKLKTADSTTIQTISKAHDLNPTIALKEETTKIHDNNRDGNIVTAATTQPQINKKRTNLANASSSGVSSSPLSITNGNVTSLLEDLKQSTTINSNGGITTDQLLQSALIKTQKSSNKTVKAPKLKEKSSTKLETNNKDSLTSAATVGPVKTSALNGVTASPATQQPIKPSAAIIESDIQNMETQSSSNSSTTMPTPTKLKSNRSLSNGQEKSLRSPFLTRGSVAERVMIFEKCPDVRNSFLNIKRPDRSDAPPRSLLKVKLHATPPSPNEQNLIQRELKNTKSVYIPRFYFPHGKPQPTIALERTLRGILSAFDTFPNNQVTKDELPRILKICGLPYYWRMPVMVFCQQHNSGLVERQRFVEFWKQMNVYCHDDASRFVYILSRGQRMRSYILPEDLAPLVQDVVDTHPGLAFLKEATEFHSRYVHTVIARIFYSVNRSWSGKISISELKKSDLLEIVTLLEEEDDINQIMAFFSYEHFYVIYCKFWELDKDHDLLISQDDLARHSDHALSTRIVERIFSGCVTRTDNKKHPDDESKMSYTDFVWFLLSEEDKRTPTAIEYWFRCMDIDGDGLLSMYELEYFYEEQQQRMESIGIESLPFEDCLCQMLDMIKPKRRDAVTLGDLKNCKMTHVFFDTFFNLEKYLDHEQRDPFASQRDEYATDWDRFAAQEYELLITEENE
ncbi:serine/threonine-protein phosphatase 2A regulatory subunit B'' subunit alpha [Calliphora vicina]|uniref:serine/threonine-protein phosphatase 2A regulatory subunit B'' subunit alpha n=1 Tax=Calliphora vicina TaxID=7373 RepID=UPI00325B2244